LQKGLGRMEENELLLLGLLLTQSQHGYQINEFIEKNLSRITEMKKGNAYAVLERLAKEGFVDVHSEQEGKRPQRKVYSITPSGQARFMELLKADLAETGRLSLGGNIGLMFIDHLSGEEIIGLLEEKLKKVREQLAAYQGTPKHGFGIGVDLAVDRMRAIFQADESWLDAAIRQLKAEDSSR